MKSINEAVLRKMIRSLIAETLTEESEASKEAKQKGLEYMNAGRWGKNGKVTHITQNGKLVSSDVHSVSKKANLDPVIPRDSNKPIFGYSQTKDANTPVSDRKPVARIEPEKGKATSMTAGDNKFKQRIDKQIRDKTGSAAGFDDPLVAASMDRNVDAALRKQDSGGSRMGTISQNDRDAKKINQVKNGWDKMSPQLQKRAAIAVKHAALRNPVFDDVDKEMISGNFEPEDVFMATDIISKNLASRNDNGKWAVQDNSGSGYEHEFEDVGELVTSFKYKTDPKTGKQALRFIGQSPDTTDWGPDNGPYNKDY